MKKPMKEADCSIQVSLGFERTELAVPCPETLIKRANLVFAGAE
jgi:hypothetical protein